MRAREIREQFLTFFETNGHTRVASSGLVPMGDPTLFFTNAGMVQFKNAFLGEETRAYVRAATSQKCLRVQGKHNDLEEVGRTPRHHTFFEMLGNFSFGDYFKADAIAFAWELLTKTCGIPADRLVATVFREDDEAETLWTKFLPKDRIFRFDEKDNFWSMGETGPCGPCSELHYDWRPGTPPTKADVESGRFWEVWNLVFMQFNRAADGTLTKLAKPSIDTGMGLERLTAILQGKQSNYDTDLFAPLLVHVAAMTNISYGADDRTDVSMRVIADHIRATAFLIAEGVLPSNEGRGYVLRRIMRRAIRHGKMLGQEAPFFHRVADTLIAEMGPAYPELVKHQQVIAQVIRTEEERFFATLDIGLQMLHTAFADLHARGQSILPGDVAFRLYDTYGFPKDLTDDIAAEQGCTVDTAGFEACMKQQRAQARSAQAQAKQVAPVYAQLQQQGVDTEFVGYTGESASSRVLAILRGGALVPAAAAGELVEIVVAQTPFYGEGGGQVGDTGAIVADGLMIRVTDTHKPFPNLFVHRARVEQGAVAVGVTVELVVDAERRDEIRKHHTATHLLHAALRKTLGEHVKQAGSLVTSDRLRFDFSHFAALMPDQLRDIEIDVNREIQKNTPLQITWLPREAAIGRGACAFFGDKYGESVRVVEVPGASMELCGGTHVRATGDIGACKVMAETGVAAGVRRIEAIAGMALVAYVQAEDARKQEMARALRCSVNELPERVARQAEQIKSLQRALELAQSRTAGAQDLMAAVQDVGGIQVLATVVDGVDPKALRVLGDRYRQKMGSGIVALGTVHEGKAAVIVMVTDDLTARFKAGELIRPVAEALGGKGGGRADMAQGGGPNVAALVPALRDFSAAVSAKQ